ncbi:glycosyltransferase [Lichenihabitans psoromatis]|uniref:glycosyltransferase n=1 Tax=Lichenihabitans psoromatis TaxID=2528642 RepID=UPI001036E810|nr:glycosyltransferase [Lichenihabitans psoromatis]
MRDASRHQDDSLKILHVLRAPLGGLFRHVLDLTREQVARGHHVGLVADASTGGAMADRVLADLEPHLALGVTRFAMRRNPHLTDVSALFKIAALTRKLRPDVLHGHGSKGATFARLPAILPWADAHVVRVYTPHGGSLNYAPGTMLHRLYMRMERIMAQSSDLILFESAYIEGRYGRSVGRPRCLSRVALNGISEAEFLPIVPAADAAEFLYVGELREAKGIDTLLDAIAAASIVTGRRLRAVLVGSGPDRDKLQARAASLGLQQDIVFAGPMPARQAFELGRVLVVPSRAESLPYVILEAAGAQLPIIATNVGGIPEIFGPYRDRLIAPNDVAGLCDKMIEQLSLSLDEERGAAVQLADHVHLEFGMARMVDGVMTAYLDAMAEKAMHSTGGERSSSLRPGGFGL